MEAPMNWTRFVLAVVASGVATMFTDWFFMGFLFHRKYLDTPDVWRLKPGESETSSVAASEALGVVSCAAFIFLCIWASALASVIGMNAIWMKLHPLVGVGHALGWLARFVVTGLIAAWLL